MDHIRAVVWTCAVLFLGGCDNTTPEEHFERALGYQQAGELNAAIIELKNTLQKDPNHASARFQLGTLYYRTGDLPSSLKELERALDLGHDATLVMPALLRTKLGLGRHEEVLGALETLDETAPYLTLGGRARLLSGDFEIADTLFERALSLDARSGAAMVGMAIVKWRDGDLPAAKQLLQRAVEAAPDEWEHWAAKAQFELANADVDAAINSYQTMLAIPGRELSTRVGLGRAFLVKRDLPAALEQANRVLQRAPRLPPALYIKAVVEFENGEIDAAEASVREILAVVPNHLLGQYMMGVIKYRQNQFGQAADHLLRFLATNPANVVVRKMVAAIRMEQKNFADVIDLLEDDAVAAPDAQVLAMLGTGYLGAGRIDDARIALEQAAAMAPDNAALRSQLAMVYIAAGDNAKAGDVLAQAAEMNEGETTRDLFLQALVSLREGRFEEALERGQRLVEEAPDNAIAYNVLGAAKVGLGDLDGAIDAFNEALDVNPSYAPAVQNLSRLAELDDPDRAVSHFQRLVDQDPGNIAALIGQARAHFRAGRRDAAQKVLRQADAALPADASSLQRAQMGGLLYSIGLEDLARARFDAVVANGERTGVFQVVAIRNRVGDSVGVVDTLRGWLAGNADDEEARLALASALITTDESAEALTLYESMIDDLPDNPAVLNNMAWLYMERQDKRALPTARRAFELAGDSPQIADTLGWILLQAGEIPEAVRMLEAAGSKLTDNASVQYHLAEAYRRSGDAARAAGALDKALTTPAFPEREEALKLKATLAL